MFKNNLFLVNTHTIEGIFYKFAHNTFIFGINIVPLLTLQR